MSIPLYRAPSFYEALKAEGFILPEDCADIRLDLPVDGMVQLVCHINITDRNVEQIGRALVRMAKKGV